MGSKSSQLERHLGAPVTTETFQHEYIKKKTDGWIDCVESLATIAETEPHAAFAAYTHCLQCNWTFLCRTMPGAAALFQPLDVIRKVFIETYQKGCKRLRAGPVESPSTPWRIGNR